MSPACLCTASGLGQVLLAGLLPSGRASFGASFKDCMLSAFPSISKNLTGQEFHGTAYHDPEDKTRRYNKQSYGRCQAWGHDFLGHRFGWGPHRFACLSHPCRVSGPFLINLIVLNSDGGSYIYLSAGWTKAGGQGGQRRKADDDDDDEPTAPR